MIPNVQSAGQSGNNAAGWTMLAMCVLCAVLLGAASPETSAAGSVDTPDVVYVGERLPSVVIADCTLREERTQGVWRFLREVDLTSIAPERVSYVRGEDGRYVYILYGLPESRPVLFRQERDGRVVSEHTSGSVVFVSEVSNCNDAAALHSRIRSLAEGCAALNMNGQPVAP